MCCVSHFTVPNDGMQYVVVTRERGHVVCKDRKGEQWTEVMGRNARVVSGGERIECTGGGGTFLVLRVAR